MATIHYVNDNTHDAYVPGDGRELVRVPRGHVLSVQEDSALHRGAQRTSNLREVTEDEAQDVRESLVSGGDLGEVTRLGGLGNEVASATAELSHAVASAPLQVVVGDDQAPYGPGTGTVTTKQAIVQDGGSEEYQAFAQGEPKGKVEQQEGAPNQDGEPLGPHGTPVSSQVHNEQVAARDTVEEIARDLTAPSDQPVEGRDAETKPRRRAKAKKDESSEGDSDNKADES